MLNKTLLLMCTLTCSLMLYSQEPPIVWQKTFGGTSQDLLNVSIQTSDNGYLLGGYSLSNSSATKTENCIGGYDYWVIKLSSSGTVDWQNTIGGTADDYLTDVIQTTDGGYMLGGYSRSPVSGDKNEGVIGGGTTNFDYWIVKLSSAGSIEWQNTIGGNSSDYLYSIEQTSDGGFILGGSSSSLISGDKTENTLGSDDFWLVKLDGAGNILWQNTIGGSSYDALIQVEQTIDGGYILGGESRSVVSGDKSEANLGGMDYWVIKTDATGNLIWQNTIGGSLDEDFKNIHEINTGNYIIGGCSYSDAGFDKTENNFDPGNLDLWIVLIDAAGNILSQNTIGSSDDDNACDISVTADGGFIVGSDSNGGITGDKTEPSMGSSDYWVIKLDGSLNILWQNIIGGSSSEYFTSVIPTSDTGYFVSGYSTSTISGDKTQALIGSYDYWVLKLGSDNCVPTVYYHDLDIDGFGDASLSAMGCEPPPHYVSDFTDCDDHRYYINPVRPELCNQLDDDCDGNIDNGLTACTLPPVLSDQNTISGLSTDELKSISATTDGGYIVCGNSNSPAGADKTMGQIGGDDIWLVKVDADLNIMWDKTLGSIKEEDVSCIKQAADGGYIIGGSIDINNVTHWDYKVIKTDATGNVQWQTTIGGTGSDFLYCVTVCPDGGFLVGGTSSSPVSGTKTSPFYGIYDWWIIKLNSSGGIEWQKSYGGNQDESPRSIIATSDGGFAIAGYSASGASGNKTVACFGISDYWVIKTDGNGNIQWQKVYGGTDSDDMASIMQTTDGGYLLGGGSKSPVSGNKSEPVFGSGDYSDTWILKTDALGNIEWQKTFGGDYSDYCQALTYSSDGNFISTGISNSWLTDYNYFDGDFSDVWSIKFSTSGDIIWQKLVAANGPDYSSGISVGTDGKIALGIQSWAAISGDKTEASIELDYWLVLLDDSNCIAVPEICNAFDDNCNGLIDDGITETISISAGGATIFCQGGSVLLSATYSGATIQWKKNGADIPGAISSTYVANKSGNYSAVTTSACGTATSATIAVTVNKNPNASISAGGPTTFCAGGSVTLSETPVAGCSYQWYKGASALAGATSTSYVATTAGNYKCRVTKTATGCYKNSNAIMVSVPCREGDAIISDDNAFSIYPNPNNGIFTINSNTSTGAIYPLEGGLRGVTSVTIYNSLGQIIYSEQLNNSAGELNETIHLSNIPAGIYIIQLNNGIYSSEQNFIIE